MADVTEGSAQGPKKKVGKPTGKVSQKTQNDLDIRDPDGFQDSMIHVWSWIEKNAILVTGVFAVLIVASIIAVIVGWYGRHQEHKAQDAFFAVESKYTKTKEGFDRAKMKAALPALTKEEKPSEDKVATGDLAKDYGTTIDELSGIASKYKGTSAGAQAGILAADAYMTYNQPDKAAALAEETVKGIGDKHLLGNLARMQWGTATAAKGDCKAAIGIWAPILDNKEVAYLQSDAALRSGICYESVNDNVKAMEMYNKVVGEGGQESASATTAKGLLRALELKTKTAAAPAAPAKG